MFNERGQPEAVKYHLLPTFLLAGYQEQQRVIAEQAKRMATMEGRLMELEAQLARMETILPAAQSTAFVQREAQRN